jgi:hypothetical protein
MITSCNLVNAIARQLLDKQI